jgi:hypothetical protein
MNFINEVFKDVPDEEKSNLAHFICFQATVQGSFNTFEGIGVLEATKLEYIEACDAVMSEECGCSGCGCESKGE